MFLGMRTHLRRLFVALIILCLTYAVLSTLAAPQFRVSASSFHPQTVSPAPALAVAFPLNGTIVQKGTTTPVVLHGVNRDDTEKYCIDSKGNGSGIFSPQEQLQTLTDGYQIPVIDEVTAMRDSWHINVVRIPLNEDCWLGINGSQANTWIGATYRGTIADYVNELTTNGINVILSLQYSAPGTTPSFSINNMPDFDYSAAFWNDPTIGVATIFGGNDAIIFDAFNEPNSTSPNGDNSRDWYQWEFGNPQNTDTPCVTNVKDYGGKPYHCLGMADMVSAIRHDVNAPQTPDNIIMLGGLNFSKWFACANQVDNCWFSHLPNDSYHNLLPDGHSYKGVGEWDSFYPDLLINHGFPLIAGEIGDDEPLCNNGDSHGQYIWDKMNALDTPGAGGVIYPRQSYLIWAWVAGSPGHFRLIDNFQSYHPVLVYGEAAYDHFSEVSGFSDCS